MSAGTSSDDAISQVIAMIKSLAGAGRVERVELRSVNGRVRVLVYVRDLDPEKSTTRSRLAGTRAGRLEHD